MYSCVNSHLASQVKVSCPHSKTKCCCPCSIPAEAMCTKNSRYCGLRRNLCTAPGVGRSASVLFHKTFYTHSDWE